MKSFYFLAVLVLLFTKTKSQNVGIGTLNPLAKLHVAESNVLFSKSGEFILNPGLPPISGSGIRMMWYADKGAFRAGYVNSVQWDKDFVGNGSTAFGTSSFASGNASFAGGSVSRATNYASFAMGDNTNSSGFASTTFGSSTIASGLCSFATGNLTKATGSFSGAFGQNTSATNNNAMAFGWNTEAKSHSSATFGLNSISKSDYSLVIGKFNDTTGTNRLFEIGNGTANNARKNILTVLNTGTVGVGTSTPSRQFEVVDLSANPVTLAIGNRAGFGAGSIEFVSDYGLLNQWRPAFMQTKDMGNFTGALQFFTNGVGPAALYGRLLNFELRNGIAYTATGTVSSYSDAPLKHSITSFTDGLNIINKINPVQFYYNADAPFASDKQQIGIIAQELELIAPYMVEQNKEGKVDDLRTVNNQAYTFLLINAVKEQQTQLEKQAAEIKQQKNELRELKLLVEQLIKK